MSSIRVQTRATGTSRYDRPTVERAIQLLENIADPVERELQRKFLLEVIEKLNQDER